MNRVIESSPTVIEACGQGDVTFQVSSLARMRTFWFADPEAAHASVIKEIWIGTHNVLATTVGGIPGVLIQPLPAIFVDAGAEFPLDLLATDARSSGGPVRVVLMNITREPLTVVLKAIVEPLPFSQVEAK